MMSYSELQELEILLSDRLCAMRLSGASADARLVVAKWLANIVIQKAAVERKGLENATLYLPQSGADSTPQERDQEQSDQDRASHPKYNKAST